MRREQLTAACVVAALVLIASAALLWPSASPEAPPEASSSEFSDAQNSKAQQAPVPKFERTPAQPASTDRGATQEEPVGDGASPLAPSLQRQVEEIILQMRNPLVPEESVYRTLDRVDDVSKNPAFNPDGKTLTIEQRVHLAKLVDEQNNQFQNAGDVQREAHVDASLSALRSNQFVYIEMGANVAENREKVSKAKESLSLRFGKELRDWRCNESFRSSTDGESWIVLVWYAAFQHPGPFGTADALVETLLEKDENYRRFFANLH